MRTNFIRSYKTPIKETPRVKPTVPELRLVPIVVVDPTTKAKRLIHPFTQSKKSYPSLEF